MNLEVTYLCSSLTSLLDSHLSCFCLASYCSQHAGKLHHPRPGQTPVPVPLPLQRSMCMEHRLSFRKLLRNVSSHLSQVPVKSLGRCVYRAELSELTTILTIRLTWHRSRRFRMPMAISTLRRLWRSRLTWC